MKLKKIVFTSDHRGVELKRKLTDWFMSREISIDDYQRYVPIDDLGPFKSTPSVDYPDMVKPFATNMQLLMLMNESEKDDYRGVLICGSGFGVNMAANRYKHIRAATIRTVSEAKIARQHGNINTICLGADYTDYHASRDIVETFLETEFEGGRHERRINKL